MNLSLRFSKARQHVIASAIVGSMLLVLPSCQIPKLRKPEPAPDLPGGFSGGNISQTGATSTENASQTSEELPKPRELNPGAAGPGGGAGPGGSAQNPEELPKPRELNHGPTSAENSSRLGIEEFYKDPVLTALIYQAIAGNRELKILDQEVQIASNEILARRGAYLPFVTFGASGGMDKPSLYTPLGAAENQLLFPGGFHFPDPLPNTQVGFNLFWQLDIWRELRNARDAAAQRYIVASERRNYFVTRLVAEIAENYFTLMALDKRLENLDRIIELQEQSLHIAEARFKAGRGTTGALPVRRFQAEVRKNQSEILIVRQDIIEVENRINFLVNRFPQPVERDAARFFDLTIHALGIGVPSQLLQNRPDIRQAERDLVAAGLDIRVARAHFFPRVDITGGIGYQAFSPRYLFITPDSLIATAAGNLIAPVINKKAIQAEYLSANARQLETVYTYQRVILNAFTEVVNRVSMVENYRKSIEIKKQQLEALQASVETASKLFQNARVEYIEVLFAQRDLLDARMVLIDTKKQQLSAIVNAYQALGGGDLLSNANGQSPLCHR